MEEGGTEVFDRLGAGDVLLFDGSHTALMNSDATVFFLELLPRLPAGLLVGIDDLLLPDDYPPSWTGRVYGEQYLLAAFLFGGRGMGPALPRVVAHHGVLARAALRGGWPVVENRFGRNAGSFWLERVAT